MHLLIAVGHSNSSFKHHRLRSRCSIRPEYGTVVLRGSGLESSFVQDAKFQNGTNSITSRAKSLNKAISRLSPKIAGHNLIGDSLLHILGLVLHSGAHISSLVLDLASKSLYRADCLSQCDYTDLSEGDQYTTAFRQSTFERALFHETTVLGSCLATFISITVTSYCLYQGCDSLRSLECVIYYLGLVSSISSLVLNLASSSLGAALGVSSSVLSLVCKTTALVLGLSG